MPERQTGQTENDEVRRFDAPAAAEHIPEMVERDATVPFSSICEGAAKDE